MTTNRKATGRAFSMPRGLAAGGGLSLLITLLTTAVLAKLIDNEILAETHIGYGVMIMILLASFFGAVLSSRVVKHRKTAVCMMSGMVYFCTLIAITALFFGGQYQAVGVTALLILGGCGSAVLLGLRQGRGQKHRMKWKHNR